MERLTSQRQAILRAFEQAGRPLAPPEVHDLAKAEAPSLGMATVYRALRQMEETGLIVPVQLPGEPARYEHRSLADEHHHHFHCRRCDRLFDIEGCPGDLASLAPRGFEVRAHELTLYGLCRDCRGTRGSGGNGGARATGPPGGE